MISNQMMRQRFRDDAVHTARPERVVVMAFDRIERDLAEALEAIDTSSPAVAHQALCHAQALLAELQLMLDVDAWEHGPQLADIYEYLIGRLVHANLTKSREPVIEVQRHVRDLGDAFRVAAAEVFSMQRELVAGR
ncbi:MAG: flagellar export chaperone FliS [Ilumatobacteraceae bacterium]